MHRHRVARRRPAYLALGPALLFLVSFSLGASACQATPTSAPATTAPSIAATAVIGAVETVTPVPAPATATRPVASPAGASTAPLASPAAATAVPPTVTNPPATVTTAPSPTSPPQPTLTLTVTASPTPTVTPVLEPKALLAQAMLLAMNAERARSDAITPAFSQGIAPAKPQPLAWDERVARVADAYARDMATRNFFSHTSPEGKTPQDRLRDAGIDFKLATENIYMAQEQGAVETAMTWFMQDQLHRDAILDPRYNRTGIGVYIQDRMVYFVQMFITAP